MHKISSAYCRKNQTWNGNAQKVFLNPFNRRLRLLWNACGQILVRWRVEQPSTGWLRKFQTGRSQLFTTCCWISWLLPPSPSQLFTTCRRISWFLLPSPSQLFTTCRWLSWLLPPSPSQLFTTCRWLSWLLPPSPSQLFTTCRWLSWLLPPSPSQLFTTCRWLSWLLPPYPSLLCTMWRPISWFLLPSASQLLTMCHELTIIAPVVDMARVVMILMRANPFWGPLEPRISWIFWALKFVTFLGSEMATTEASAIFDRCLDSNPESCLSKQARYRLDHPYPFLATHLPICHLSPYLAKHLLLS